MVRSYGVGYSTKNHRWILGLTLAASLFGCGKSDGQPPPGANDVSPQRDAAGDFVPPEVSLDGKAEAGDKPAAPEKK